jgi:hypothetical protein
MSYAFLQIQSLNDERLEQVQQAASARELELQTEFESLSNEMMERIEQLQEEVQGLLEFKQHKVSTGCAPSTCSVSITHMQLGSGNSLGGTGSSSIQRDSCAAVARPDGRMQGMQLIIVPPAKW